MRRWSWKSLLRRYANNERRTGMETHYRPQFRVLRNFIFGALLAAVLVALTCCRFAGEADRAAKAYGQSIRMEVEVR